MWPAGRSLPTPAIEQHEQGQDPLLSPNEFSLFQVSVHLLLILLHAEQFLLRKSARYSGAKFLMHLNANKNVLN